MKKEVKEVYIDKYNNIYDTELKAVVGQAKEAIFIDTLQYFKDASERENFKAYIEWIFRWLKNNYGEDKLIDFLKAKEEK